MNIISKLMLLTFIISSALIAANPKTTSAKLFKFNNTWVEELTEPSDNDNRPLLIFVHGQNLAEGYTPISFNVAGESLAQIYPMALAAAKNSNYAGIYGFKYDFTKKLDELGKNFSKLVAPLANKNPIHIVAYSMGGLVARWALEQEDLDSTKVQHLITIATPHKGIPVPEHLQKMLPIANLISILNPQMTPLVTYLNSLPQLLSESDVLKKLNSKEKNVASKYHIIQGIITKPSESIPASGFLIPAIYEPKNIKNDGVVPTLNENELKEILPCDSIEFILHDDVDHTRFLERDFIDKNTMPYLNILTKKEEALE